MKCFAYLIAFGIVSESRAQDLKRDIPCGPRAR